MTKKGSIFKALLIFICCIALLMGCSKEDDSVTTAGDAINSETSDVLDGSIMTLPKSVSQKQSAKRSVDNSNCSGYLCIYAGIPMFIGMAESMGDFTKQLLTNIMQSGLLNSIPLGEIVDIPADSSDPDAPSAILVEKEVIKLTGDSAAETYWKISLYFNAATSPDLIVRFRLNSDETAAKGRILWKMTDDDEFDTLTALIEITRYIDVTFDGGVASTTMSLEIKLIQDLSNHIAYAQNNWTTLTPAQKDDLDIGQPGKVFVNASYDGSVYTIYGTSYHPGWATEATLNGDGPQWGSARSMYMYKVKANDIGAKLYLALPVETTTDVTNVWTTDSMGEIFSNMMVSQINEMIAAKTPIEKALILSYLGDTGDGIISKTELETFLNSTQTDPNIISFQQTYYAIKYMINPAFFSEANGFLGTYDETLDKFYGLSGTTIGEIAKPAEFSAINALDLSTITPYVPADVVAATIKIE